MARLIFLILALLPVLARALLGRVPSVSRSRVATSRIFSSYDDEDEEFRAAVAENKAKFRRTGLVNEKGVKYAPWMDIDEMAVQKVREERAARRRAEKKRSEGAMWTDISAGELGGIGLKKRVVDDKVELEWTTDAEIDTVGFIVSKTRGGERNWQMVASHKDWQPLVSKGPNGGTYTYQDPTSELGTWYYRVTEENKGGGKADICQVLVDVQSDSEKLAGKVAVFGFVAVVVGLVAAASLIDPMQ